METFILVFKQDLNIYRTVKNYSEAEQMNSLKDKHLISIQKPGGMSNHTALKNTNEMELLV